MIITLVGEAGGFWQLGGKQVLPRYGTGHPEKRLKRGISIAVVFVAKRFP
jgi:hypothetical protein